MCAVFRCIIKIYTAIHICGIYLTFLNFLFIPCRCISRRFLKALRKMVSVKKIKTLGNIIYCHLASAQHAFRYFYTHILIIPIWGNSVPVLKMAVYGIGGTMKIFCHVLHRKSRLNTIAYVYFILGIFFFC